jgi:hypothetical protein
MIHQSNSQLQMMMGLQLATQITHLMMSGDSYHLTLNECI